MQRPQVQRGAIHRDSGRSDALAELGEQLVVAGEKPALADQPIRQSRGAGVSAGRLAPVRGGERGHPRGVLL